jgi:hypothetical protein
MELRRMCQDEKRRLGEIIERAKLCIPYIAGTARLFRDLKSL